MKAYIISIFENEHQHYVKFDESVSEGLQLQGCSLNNASIFTDLKSIEKILNRYNLPQPRIIAVNIDEDEIDNNYSYEYDGCIDFEDQIFDLPHPIAFVFESSNTLSNTLINIDLSQVTNRIWLLPNTKAVFEDKLLKDFPNNNPITFITEKEYLTLDESIKAKITFFRIKA